ncbi:MAG TPA: helix-turn-helix transcriptional regulator [Caulobacteraceae bacterium]|nr:helix-turn-helix transcriptional regulator [Caulobacteraceae bacterium]
MAVFARNSFLIVNAAGEVVGDDATDWMRQPNSIRTRTVSEALGVRDGPSREKLMRALARAINEQARSVILLGDAFDERRMVTVRPAREGGRAAISCVDLDAGVSLLRPADVIELFDLSRAEAEIAIQLTRGASLAEVADQRGVQHETVRGQVKTVLRKVGVANQKQLAAILTQIGAALLTTQPLPETAA